MKVTLLDSTHPVVKEIINQEVHLYIGMSLHFTFDPFKNENEFYHFDLRYGEWMTSNLKSIEYKEVQRDYYEITCKTTNNTYVFSKGEKSGLKPYTEEEMLAMKMAFGMHLI
jgi:hypothetical protein